MAKNEKDLDDWFSMVGVKARKKGVKNKESKRRKLAYCALFSLSFVIYLLIGAVHTYRSQNALKISNDFSDHPLALLATAYDTCQIPAYVKDPHITQSEYDDILFEVARYCKEPTSDCDKGTQWQGAFTFNAACLLITSVNFIILIFGSEFFYARYAGTICNCCYACCHCSAFITALAMRYNPLGKLCYHNVAPATYEGDQKWSEEITYQNDGAILGGLATV